MSKRTIGKRRMAALAAAVGLVSASHGFAQVTPEVKWIGGGTAGAANPWTTGTNWDSGTAPVNADVNPGNDPIKDLQFVEINSGVAGISGADVAQAPFLALGLKPGDNGRLEISGGTLTTGEMRVGGRETINDNLNDWSSPGTYSTNAGGTGYVLQTGGTVNVNYNAIVFDPDGGGPDDTKPIQSLYIGDAGTASNSANGTYEIQGGTLVSGVANDDAIVVGTGVGTQGTFIQSGGSVTSTGFLTVARGGATASYTMSGGTLAVGTGALSTNQNFRIGDGEYPTTNFQTGTTGSFIISNGTATVANDTTVGRNSGTGSVLITGATTVYNGNNNINVGHGGTGSFTQGTVGGTGPTVNIGSTAGTHGMSVGISSVPTLPGNGSYLLRSGLLAIGNSTADYLAIGDGVNGTGTFTMSGGTVTTTDLVQIGRNNSGNDNRLIQSGGSISGLRLIIGGGTSATSGRGSWTVTGGSVTGSQATNIAFGDPGNTCQGTLDMQGGTWTLTGTTGTNAVMAVGNGTGGQGTILHSGGTISVETSVGVIDIGRGGASGSYTLSGTGVLKTTLLRLVDSPGTKTVNFNGGTSTITTLTLGNVGNMTIGGGTHTIGTINFSTGSTFTTNVNLSVPTINHGTSTINVGTGATLTATTANTASAIRTITKGGAGTFTITGTQTHFAGSQMVINAGTVNENSSPAGLNFNNNAALNFNTAATLTIGTLNGSGTTTVTAGTLSTAEIRQGTFALTGTGNALTRASATPYTSASNTSTSKVTSLTISGASSKLDLTNTKLITQDASMPTTPVYDGVNDIYTYSGVHRLVQLGRGDGTWNGSTGIKTSQTDATTGILTSLAVGSGAELRGLAPTQTELFAGQTINGNSTVVMYTYGGDADMDGDLDGDDYFWIDSNATQSETVFGWHQGDFNYDGRINGDDYFIIDSNILQAQGSGNVFYVRDPEFAAGAGGLTAVPEPASLGLLGVGAMSLMRRRRRN